MNSPVDKVQIDPAVVAALYVEHADELRAFLTGVLRDGELAVEVLQTTFARAMEFGHVVQEGSLKGWLFQVAFHEAMAVRRRQKLQKRSLRKLAWLTSRSDDSPLEHAIRWETVERVRAALDGLPSEQREVVRQRIYEGKTFAEIAAESGTPLSTVLTRMRLALQKLAKRLDSRPPGAAEPD